MACPPGLRRGIPPKKPSHGVVHRGGAKAPQPPQITRFDFPRVAIRLSLTQSRGIGSTLIPSAGGIGEYIQP